MNQESFQKCISSINWSLLAVVYVHSCYFFMNSQDMIPPRIFRCWWNISFYKILTCDLLLHPVQLHSLYSTGIYWYCKFLQSSDGCNFLWKYIFQFLVYGKNLASAKSFVPLKRLSPTKSSTKCHCLRVYYQTMIWMKWLLKWIMWTDVGKSMALNLYP